MKQASIASVALLAGFLCSAPVHAQRVIHEIPGDPAGGHQTGGGVAGLGDLNHDGYDDFAVAEPTAQTETTYGRVLVFSGLSGAVLFPLEGDPASFGYGRSLAGPGDLDQDGTPDILVGANEYWNEDDIGAGRVYVYSGVDGSLIDTIEGPSQLAHFGTGLDGVGDLNGDGHPDFVVGTPGDSTAFFHGGSVQVFSGADRSELLRVDGTASNFDLGRSVAAAGDVDGDGIVDLIAGADPVLGTGLARVFSGVDGSLLHEFVGEKPSDLFGNAVEGLGDVNGDGRDDVAVAAWMADAFTPNAGSVWVYSGLDGTELSRIKGDGPGDLMGEFLDSIDDLDGDGIRELLVGGRGDTVNGSYSGQVRIVSPEDGRALYTFVGDRGGDLLSRCASAGDVNGDGHPDVIVGAPFSDLPEFNTGYARVIAGGPSSLVVDRAVLSLSTGGTQRLEIDAGAEHAGSIYWVVGTTAGTFPALPIGQGLGLDLVPDGSNGWYLQTLLRPNKAPLKQSLGFLDTEGRATASFTVPAGSDPGLAFVGFQHAAVVLEPFPAAAFTTGTQPLTLKP